MEWRWYWNTATPGVNRIKDDVELSDAALIRALLDELPVVAAEGHDTWLCRCAGQPGHLVGVQARAGKRATVKTRSEWPADWDQAVVLTRPQLGDAEAHGRGG
jgi:hypothetical protein